MLLTGALEIAYSGNSGSSMGNSDNNGSSGSKDSKGSNDDGDDEYDDNNADNLEQGNMGNNKDSNMAPLRASFWGLPQHPVQDTNSLNEEWRTDKEQNKILSINSEQTNVFLALASATSELGLTRLMSVYVFRLLLVKGDVMQEIIVRQLREMVSKHPRMMLLCDLVL